MYASRCCLFQSIPASLIPLILIAQYLASAEPLVLPEEYRATKVRPAVECKPQAAVEDFRTGIGKELDNDLRQKVR